VWHSKYHHEGTEHTKVELRVLRAFMVIFWLGVTRSQVVEHRHREAIIIYIRLLVPGTMLKY
jgi:hypothetical protein